MRYRASFLALLLLPLFIGGCTTAQIERAEKAVASAQTATERASQGVAQAEAALIKAQDVAKVAQEALTVARQVAEATGSEKAKEAVAKAQAGVDAAQAVVAQLQASVPAAKAVAEQAAAAVAQAEKGVEAAKAAQEGGGGTLQVLIAGAIAFLTGNGTGLLAAAGKVAKAVTAVRLTAQHGDRMEAATTDAEVEAAKKLAKAEQAAAGVSAIIAQARGKV